MPPSKSRRLIPSHLDVSTTSCGRMGYRQIWFPCHSRPGSPGPKRKWLNHEQPWSYQQPRSKFFQIRIRTHQRVGLFVCDHFICIGIRWHKYPCQLRSTSPVPQIDSLRLCVHWLLDFTPDKGIPMTVINSLHALAAPYRQFPLRLPHEIADELDRIAKRTRITKTAISQIAIQKFIGEIERSGVDELLNQLCEA